MPTRDEQSETNERLKTTALNPQIIDSVNQVNQIIEEAQQVANGIVYQQMAQSIGLAVQDAVSHLRTTLMLNNVVMAKTLQLVLAGEKTAQEAADTLALAQESVQQSVNTLETVGSKVVDILNQFSETAPTPAPKKE